MTRKHGATGGTHPAQHVSHPHSVAILEAEALREPFPDQPFAEGARDTLDPDLRYRMISEAAYRLYAERGYADGSDVDDWLAAEAEVDHLLLNPDESATIAAH
jgi:hypothetical protein